jgi:hypothetical protein
MSESLRALIRNADCCLSGPSASLRGLHTLAGTLDDRSLADGGNEIQVHETAR